MKKHIVQSSQAPQAIGPYAQAVSAASWLFLSGQIALSPESGELVGAQDIKAQTHQVMKNLGAVLRAAGLDFEHVVKTTIYLVDLQNFQQVNEVYAQYFDSYPPARATVQVAKLPKNADVEIDAIAVMPPQETSA